MDLIQVFKIICNIDDIQWMDFLNYLTHKHAVTKETEKT